MSWCPKHEKLDRSCAQCQENLAKTPRQHAKEMQCFYVKCVIDGRYLPKEMQAKWGARLTSEGPMFRSRKKDMLALGLFLQRANVSLYECLVDAGRIMKERDL